MGYLEEFKPRPQTTELHDGLAMLLDQFNRRIQTTNNLNTKQVVEQNIMPILLLIVQWTNSHFTDLADYTQAMTATDESTGLEDEDLDLLGEVHDHLQELDRFFAGAFVTGNVDAKVTEQASLLRQTGNELAGRLGELLDGLSEGDGGEEGEGGAGAGTGDDDIFEADDSEPTPSSSEVP